MAEKVVIFWTKRAYDAGREMFFAGLLEIAIYLLDKTLDEGMVMMRKSDSNAVHIQVPFGPRMRNTIFEHLKFLMSKYQMPGFTLAGVPCFANIYTDIRVILPQCVRDVTSFGSGGGRKMSLSTFRFVLERNLEAFQNWQDSENRLPARPWFVHSDEDEGVSF